MTSSKILNCAVALAILLSGVSAQASLVRHIDLPADATNIELILVDEVRVRSTEPVGQVLDRIEDGFAIYRRIFRLVPTIAVTVRYQSYQQGHFDEDSYGISRFTTTNTRVVQFPVDVLSDAERAEIKKFRLIDRNRRERANSLFSLDVSPTLQVRRHSAVDDSHCWEYAPGGGNETFFRGGCKSRVVTRTSQVRPVTISLR